MDLNPQATGYSLGNAPVQNDPTNPFKQQPVHSVSQGISNMVNALGQGWLDAKEKQRGIFASGGMMGTQPPTSTTTSDGGPLSVQPPSINSSPLPDLTPQASFPSALTNAPTGWDKMTPGAWPLNPIQNTPTGFDQSQSMGGHTPDFMSSLFGLNPSSGQWS